MVSSGKRETSTAVPAAPPAYISSAGSAGGSGRKGELHVSHGMTLPLAYSKKKMTAYAKRHISVHSCG